MLKGIPIGEASFFLTELRPRRAKRSTVSGVGAPVHRNLPSDGAQNAMIRGRALSPQRRSMRSTQSPIRAFPAQNRSQFQMPQLSPTRTPHKPQRRSSSTAGRPGTADSAIRGSPSHPVLREAVRFTPPREVKTVHSTRRPKPKIKPPPRPVPRQPPRCPARVSSPRQRPRELMASAITSAALHQSIVAAEQHQLTLDDFPPPNHSYQPPQLQTTPTMTPIPQ